MADIKQNPTFRLFRIVIIVLLLVKFGLPYLSNYIHQTQIDKCNDVTQSDQSLSACTKLIDSGLSDPVAYMKRAVAYVNKGMWGPAMEDLNRSLTLNPNLASSLTLRGMIYLSKRRYSDAILDFDHALKMHNNNNTLTASLFELRGYAKFYTTSPSSAVDDFENAVRLDPSEILPVIWLHLAKIRSSRDDKEEFDRNSRATKKEWPAPLITVYQYHISVQDVLQEAQKGSIEERAEKMCDANFYGAEFYLTTLNRAKAISLFNSAKIFCSPKDLERNLVDAELGALTPVSVK